MTVREAGARGGRAGRGTAKVRDHAVPAGAQALSAAIQAARGRRRSALGTILTLDECLARGADPARVMSVLAAAFSVETEARAYVQVVAVAQQIWAWPDAMLSEMPQEFRARVRMRVMLAPPFIAQALNRLDSRALARAGALRDFAAGLRWALACEWWWFDQPLDYRAPAWKTGEGAPGRFRSELALRAYSQGLDPGEAALGAFLTQLNVPGERPGRVPLALRLAIARLIGVAEKTS